MCTKNCQLLKVFIWLLILYMVFIILQDIYLLLSVNIIGAFEECVKDLELVLCNEVMQSNG